MTRQKANMWGPTAPVLAAVVSAGVVLAWLPAYGGTYLEKLNAERGIGAFLESFKLPPSAAGKVKDTQPVAAAQEAAPPASIVIDDPVVDPEDPSTWVPYGDDGLYAPEDGPPIDQPVDSNNGPPEDPVQNVAWDGNVYPVTSETDPAYFEGPTGEGWMSASYDPVNHQWVYEYPEDSSYFDGPPQDDAYYAGPPSEEPMIAEPVMADVAPAVQAPQVLAAVDDKPKEREGKRVVGKGSDDKGAFVIYEGGEARRPDGSKAERPN